MKWTYKNTDIEICEATGKFYFSIGGETEFCESLSIAKYRIDVLKKEYYHFSKKDINKLTKKLDNREKEFVLSILEELERHRCNAYCEMGLADLEFSWDM